MATISLNFRTSKKTTKGLVPIYFRFYNGKTYFIASGHAVKEEYWDSSNSLIRAQHPLSKNINRFLDMKLLEINRFIIDMETISKVPGIEQVKLIISGISAHSWFTFADKHIDYAKEINYSTGIKEQSIRNKVFKITGDFSLHDITYDFLIDLTIKLAAIPNNPTTVQKAIRYVRDIFSYAAKNKAIDANPELFRQIKVVAVPKEKVKMSRDEVDKMYLGRKNISGNERLACDMFLFSYYTFGMRFKNIYLFKKNLIDGERITYSMTKNNKRLHIKLHTRLNNIVNDYIDSDSDYLFPLKQRNFKTQKEEYLAISSRNTILNKYLKFVALRFKIDKHIHIHLARHTFADNLRKAGADPITTMNAMAHSDISTTQKYFASIDQEGLDNVVEMLY